MFNSASRMFNTLLRRLRGIKTNESSPKTRDALFPMRELAKQNNLEDLRARLKKTTKRDKTKVSETKKFGRRALSPVISVTQLCDKKSAIFDDNFMARLESQSVSYTPEWFQYATRRSTTVGGGYIPEDQFQERLSTYATENVENEQTVFSELATTPKKLKPKDKIKVQLTTSRSPRSPTGLVSPNIQRENINLVERVEEEVGGSQFPFEINAVTPEAVRIHLEQNWNVISLNRAGSSFSKARSREMSSGNNLSLARARDMSVSGNNLSLARARKVSNWKDLSLARARGVSSAHAHRENSLSLSMALVSFQYALRRSTVSVPTCDDAAFSRKLEEFGKEHERMLDEQWDMFEKLTPNVGGYTLEL